VAEPAKEVALASLPAEDEEPEDGIAPELAGESDLRSAANWDDAAIRQLGWDRLNVADPEAFSDVDAAFEAGDFDAAQSLIDDWKEKNPAQLGKADMFEGRTRQRRSGGTSRRLAASRTTTTSRPTGLRPPSTRASRTTPTLRWKPDAWILPQPAGVDVKPSCGSRG